MGRTINRTYEIEINAKFGSQFQKESFESSMNAMLKSLLGFYKDRYQKNDINIVLANKIDVLINDKQKTKRD